nr:hypothetical protein [Tanacetum cinerariifolium]
MSSFYESPQCHLNIYLCQICESNSYYSYECSQRVSLVYEPAPCYTQNFSDNDYSYDVPSVNPLIDHHCCHECGNSLNDFFCLQCTGEFCGNGAHVGYNCPVQVPSFKTLLSFPQQYTCCEDCGATHEAYKCQPMTEVYYHDQNSCYDSNSIGFDQFQSQQYTVNHHIFNAHNDFLNSQTKLMEQMSSLTSMCEMKLPVCYDDDDDEERSNSLEDNIISGLPSCVAITPNKPVDSLSIGDEHLDTIPATKLDEFIKSSVENLFSIPSESKGENECDVPGCFTTFSNVLFDAKYDFYSVDDQSLYDEDFSKEIYSDPLFDEEIIPMKIDPHPFNAESDLIECMLNHDSSIIISSMIDSLFDEFAETTHFTKRLLYDNSSPRPSEEIIVDNSNADIESFSPSPILIKDSDSLMEEIDLSFTSDDPMPPGIEEDDYASERDIPILEELLDNYSLSLPKNESYHFDIPSSSYPSAKPPDGNTGILNIKMMGDIFEQKGLEAFKISAECPMIINGKNTHILNVPLFHFYPLDQFKYEGN